MSFYKARCGLHSILVSRFIDYLFHNRDKDDLPYPRKLLNFTGISWRDQIVSFIKDCLQNGFSSWAINKFIEVHKNFFDIHNEERVVSIKEKGESEYRITLLSQNKDGMIFLFLLLVLDISQDKNFCSPVQKLTVDYILDLAKNIPDYRLRYKFKVAALSYLLPSDNRDVKSNLAGIFSDIEKLFAEELSDDNKKIKSENKFKIKLAIIDILTANCEYIRRDLAHFQVMMSNNFSKMYDFSAEDNESKTILRAYERFSEHLSYCEIAMSDNFYNKNENEKIDTLDSFLAFVGDDINKLINIGYVGYVRRSLLGPISGLFSVDVFIKKIEELIGNNQNNQNDNKIFVLFFMIMEKRAFQEFCEDEFYKKICYEEMMKLDEATNMFFPDLGKFIDKLCSFYEKDKLKIYENQNNFAHMIWVLFTAKYNNSYDRCASVENVLNCVSEQILKRKNEVRLFLYQFLEITADYFCNLSKTSDFDYDYRVINCSTILLDHLISLVEKDTDMSNDSGNKINSFIMKTFFLSDNLKFYLKQDRFVECLARIVKNEKFNFYLESQKQYSFSCIKEHLKSVMNLANNNNSFENNQLLTQYQKLLQQKNMMEKQIKDLNAVISSGNKNYWFLLVPVFGWIGCCIFYFKNKRLYQNELNELNELQTKYEILKADIDNIEKLGCKDINSFIDSEYNYDKSKENSVENANTVFNNKPSLEKNYKEPWVKFGYPSFEK